MATNGRKSSTKNGYTIVELLMVISVIGILAGITYAGYGQWRKSVATREVQSDLTGAATAMENVRNFSSGYPLAIPATFVKSAGVNLSYKAGGTTSSYCLDGSSIKVPSVVYHLDGTNGNKTPVVGTCP